MMNLPNGLSKTISLTMTVTTTPSMSIITGIRMAIFSKSITRARGEGYMCTIQANTLSSNTPCIVVLLCAGSTPNLFNNKGNTAPKHMLENTIKHNAVVTATVSAKGVRKAMARMNPATERMEERANAILNSRLRN
mmetsp:Transcript_53460/g.79456  ORF Transcript_53460/g.79456 Transcript_53460/m.79456 type:complete len:136 (-) Transcript_53460:908-1315(-)